MALSDQTSDAHHPDGKLYHRILNLANRDLCPWANRYVYWLKQPIGWLLVAAIASALIGIVVAPQGWVMFAALTGVIAVGVAWPWIAIRGIHCNLRFKRRRAYEGDRVKVVLSIRNSFPWPIWGLAVEGGFFYEELSGHDDTTAVALARIPGWATSEFEWDFEPHRRGLYPSAGSKVSNAFPFGIWAARDDIEVDSKLIVWPRTVKLASVPLVRGQELASTGCLMDVAGNTGDVLAVRPYRQGDSLKHVHWAQTARHNQFIVCERQAVAQRNVNVTIDTDPRIHSPSGMVNSLEWAIRVSASLIREFHEHGWSVTCSTRKNNTSFEQRPGLESTFDSLALLEPVKCENFSELYANTDVRQTFRFVVTTAARMEQLQSTDGLPSNTRFVVFSTEQTNRTAKPWLEIDCNHSIPGQLQKHWERLCHDTWSAN